MSDDQKNNNGQNNSPNDRFQPKVLVIWMVIIFAIISLYVFSGDQRSAEADQWTINDVLTAIEKEEVERGTIKAEPNGGMNWSRVTVYTKDSEEPHVAYAHLTDSTRETLQKSGLFREVPATTWITSLLVTFLPIVLIIVLLYWLLTRQLKMAGRGAMAFGKSKAKMLTREKDRVLFADVAGCDEAKEEVEEVVEFLKDPKKFQRIGGRIPKGVLLVGPPGTGKTLLARAVAGEADVPFFSISGSDFVEMFVGVGAARVRDMFEQGRKNAPCIVFIDEIDAVGRQRGAGLGGGNDEREQTLNSLLVEMDGFDGHEGVIIVAATNRPDVLDNALLRPGRFDRQIFVDMPDLEGRHQVLKVHAKKVTLDEEVDLSIVARNTSGFSGADLANLLNEAALLAARYGKKSITHSDIDEAREKISFGRERRRLMDDEDKKITAYHEAGHAIIQAVIDDGRLPVHKVTIIPRGRSLGSTMFMPSKDILNQSRNFALNRICCGMGGRVAEEIQFDEVTSGAAGDIKMATDIARHMVCDWGMSDLGMVSYGSNEEHIFLGREIARDQNYSEETAQRIDSAIREIIDTQYGRAKQILTDHREVLDNLAGALLEHETLEGKHVQELLEHGEIRSPILKSRPEPAAEDDTEEEEPAEKPAKKAKEDDDLGPSTAPSGIPA